MATPSTFKDVNDPSFIADGETVADTDRFFGGTAGDLPRSRMRSAMLQNIGSQIQLVAGSAGLLFGDPSTGPGFSTSVTPGAGQFGWKTTLPNSASGNVPVGALMLDVTPSADTGDSYQRGIWVEFENGYAGFAECYAIWGNNNTVMPGGGSSVWPGSSDAVGVYGSSRGAATNGINVGTYGNARGALKNFGLFGSINSGLAGGYSVAVGGFNQDGTSSPYGGVFVLGNSNSRFTGSAALLADNGGTATSAIFKAQSASTVKFQVDGNGNTVCSNAALATTATNGFVYLPSCAGAPTGVPTTFTGTVPAVIDTTNGKLWLYYGGAWHFVTLT